MYCRKKTMEENTKSPLEKGHEALEKLIEVCRDAGDFNRDLLMRIVKDNSDTEYGHQHGFDSVQSVKDYKRTVPFTEFSDYVESIKRMLKGEKNILTVYPIVHYALSSGSVGEPKKIPVSEETLKLYGAYTSNIALALIDDYYMQKENRHIHAGKKICTSVVNVTKAEDGINVSMISSAMYNAAKTAMCQVLAGPEETLYSNYQMDFRYLKSFYALKERNVTNIVAPYTTTVYDLLHFIEENWIQLVEDIREGVLSKDADIVPEIRQKLQEELQPDPERADELEKIFQEGFDTPILRRLWPNMDYINAIGSGGFVSYTNKIRRYSGDVPMCFANYACSEAMMAVVTQVESFDYTLIPMGAYFEFIPAQISDADPAELMEKTLDMDELEVGKEYEIILTNLSGFYRYRLGDVIRVTGFEGKSPEVCFSYRRSQLISIDSEKTTEPQIEYAVEQFVKESGIAVVSYSLYGDRDVTPGRYIVFLEPERYVGRAAAAKGRDILEKYLCEANEEYADRVKEMILAPLELKFLEKDSYLLYRDVMIRKGGSESQLKPVHILDTDFKKDFFFALVDEGYDEFRIEKKKKGTLFVVKVTGRIDALTAPEFEQALMDEQGRNCSYLIDLTDTEYISSTGLRVLVKLLDYVGDGGCIYLKNPTDMVRDVLNKTGVSSLMKITS
jgi:anti-anti-sigma factor